MSPKRLQFFLLASVLWGTGVCAQEGEPDPLGRMTAAYASHRATIEATAKKALDAARVEFLKNLAALEAKAKEEGDLDGVLVCREEASRVRDGGGAPGTLSTKWSPPQNLDLTQFEGGTYYQETLHRSIYGGEAGSVMRQRVMFSEGVHRFTLRAFQVPAGKEDARGVFRVGDFHQTPFSVPQTSRNSPGVFEFVCQVPTGEHMLEVEFLNDFKDPPSAPGGARDRDLIVLAISMETPGSRVVASLRHAPLAEIQEAWGRVAAKAVAEQDQALRGLGTKYLASLESLHAHLTRQGKPAEAALVLAEASRVFGLHPDIPNRRVPVAEVPAEPKPSESVPALRYSLRKAQDGTTTPDGASSPLLRNRDGAHFKSIPNGGGFLAVCPEPRSHFALPADPALNLDKSSFTVAFMIQNLLPGNGLLAYKAGGSGNASGLAIGYEGGELVFSVAGERLAVRPVGDACAWRHFVCVYNTADNTQTIYLNGARIASRQTARSLSETNASDLLVGAGSPGGKPGWEGTMSHFFVAGKALGLTEVIRLHTLDRSELDNTLRAWRGMQNPKNPAELAAMLRGTSWSFLYDDRLSRKPVSLIMTFDSGDRIRLSNGASYPCRMSSARGMDILDAEGNNELRVLFDPEMKRFNASARGVGGGNFGSRIRGNFWGR